MSNEPIHLVNIRYLYYLYIYVLIKLKDHNNYARESVERSHYEVHSTIDVFTRVGAKTKIAIDIL